MKHCLYLFLGLCIFLYGCAVDHIPPVTKGNIEGNVAVFNEYGSAAGDPSNVKVRLEGGNSIRETLTDKDGNWSFNDVPAGTYDIILSKEGFSTFKILRTPHVGGTLATVPYMNVIPLYQKTTQIITEAEVIKVGSAIGGRAKGTNIHQFFVAFIGHAGSNSPQNYVDYYHRKIPSGLAMEVWEYKAMGFKSGDKISIRFYGSIPIVYRYFDPEFNEMIFANLSEDYKEVVFTLE